MKNILKICMLMMGSLVAYLQSNTIDPKGEADYKAWGKTHGCPPSPMPTSPDWQKKFDDAQKKCEYDWMKSKGADFASLAFSAAGDFTYSFRNNTFCDLAISFNGEDTSSHVGPGAAWSTKGLAYKLVIKPLGSCKPNQQMVDRTMADRFLNAAKEASDTDKTKQAEGLNWFESHYSEDGTVKSDDFSIKQDSKLEFTATGDKGGLPVKALDNQATQKAIDAYTIRQLPSPVGPGQKLVAFAPFNLTVSMNDDRTLTANT